MTAPALRFARIIANQVHECAPDSSSHTIAVGELRETVEEMEALYEALAAAPSLPVTFDQYDRFASSYRAFREKRSVALARARGEKEAA